jgi:hypothetical protein
LLAGQKLPCRVVIVLCGFGAGDDAQENNSMKKFA